MDKNPENLFCQILKQSFVTTQSEIQAAIAIPLVVLRGIKSNLSRFETIILSTVYTQVDEIEKRIYEVLLLNKLSEFATKTNWCQIAYACQALKTELNENPSIPDSVKDYINAPYDNFEKYVCKLGFKTIISGFINDILDKFSEQLTLLFDLLKDELKLNELTNRYLQAINDSGILLLLEKLQNFANCAFATCTWDTTAENYLKDLSEKYYIDYTAGSWQINLSPLSAPLQTQQSELQTRIQKLLGICDTKSVDETIPRDKVMVK